LFARTVCSEFVHPFEQFCVEAISRDQSVEAVCAISPTFLAFDANYTELADQIAEDDGTVAGHSEVIKGDVQGRISASRNDAVREVEKVDGPPEICSTRLS
jgi:hypothetical protein